MPVVFPAGLARVLPSARVVALIPARFHSTRLPGKPLALIDGKPMVEHVYRRASACRSVDAVVVATDEERVAAAVDGFGGLAVMTRADHATGSDRLAEVADVLQCTLIVNVQGDEPLLPAEAIDAAIAPMLDGPSVPVSTLRRRIDGPAELNDPGVVKVLVDRAGHALYFTRAAAPFVGPGRPAPDLWRHLGLYVYRREFLLKLAGLPPTPLERAEDLEQLRVLEHGFKILTVETNAESVGVDTPEDLARVRRLLEDRHGSSLIER